MRTTIALLALSSFALAACGQSGSDSSAPVQSVEPGKSAAEVAFQFQPGQYRTTIKINKFDIPGVPAAALERMKGAMGKPIEMTYCMSPEKAAMGTEAMKENMAKGKCQFEKFEAWGGTVDSVMVCDSEGMKIRSTSHGTYSPTGSLITATGDMAGPGGQKTHVEQTITMERTGDCVK
ncbi:MAG: hypothetical protein C0515_00450 [Novosphingobium sp.]|nr:hypothetical protein [Novosphingobium sp.]